MSRFIDVSNPEALTEEDRQYLRDRGRVDIVSQLNLLARIDAASAVPGANERIATARRRPLDALQAPENKKQVTPPPAPPVTALRDEDAELPPYTEWSRDELIAECKARKLDASGKNADLVARLEEDDRRNG